jgi:hypothetical protein
MSLACCYDLEIQQFDVDNAYLNATLKEEIYMKQPEGYVIKGKENMAYKLNKALYGVKQAPHAWNGDIDNTLSTIGFINFTSDTCVYIYSVPNTTRLIIIGLFVDDVIILYHKQDENTWFKLKDQIKQKYKIKDLGDADFILGMRITRDRKNKLLYLDQQVYI